MAKQLEQPKPTHDEIARRAYELFEKSGRIQGHDVENWLKAEQQLIAGRRPAVEAKKAETRSHAETRSNANGLAKTTPRQPVAQRAKETQYA